MTTYFSRHTRELDIDAETRKRIWDERRVAIHFPTNEQAHLPAEDNSSLNPNDYPGSDCRSVLALVRLAQEGGYVCAQHHGHEQVQVGWVEPGSRIDLFSGKWGKLNGYQGRTAILKTVSLKKVRLINPCHYSVILVGRPRQGTLMRWPSAGTYIRNLVEDKTEEVTLQTLSPDQQEILCSEFLRSGQMGQFNLPQLAHLLLPVGRTMKDLDLVGLATDQKQIFAQVTFAPFKQARGKLADWPTTRARKVRI